MNKKKTVIVQARYTGEWTFLKDWGQWFRWRAYYDEQSALTAMEGFRLKHKGYEFRLKPKEEQ